MPDQTQNETDSDRFVRLLRENETVIYVFPLDELVLESNAAREPICRAGRRESVLEAVRSAINWPGIVLGSRTVYALVRELGLMGRAYTKVVKGKTYVILKGYPGQRTLLRGPRYLATNPTIVRMVIGPKALLNSIKRGSALTAVLYTGLDILEYLLIDSAGLPTLLGTLTSDLAQIGIASVCSALVGLGAGSVAVLGTIAAVPLVLSIGTGVLVGHILAKIDKRYGATKALIDYYESVGDDLTTTWDQIGALPETLAKEAVKWEKHMIRTVLRNSAYRY